MKQGGIGETLILILLVSLVCSLKSQTYELNTITYSRITYAVGDTLIFNVSGLVCSFCAVGLNKGIGKLDYTDKKSVFVDINNQTVKVVILKVPEIEETIKLIKDTGYEVHKITHATKELQRIIWRKEK